MEKGNKIAKIGVIGFSGIGRSLLVFKTLPELAIVAPEMEVEKPRGIKIISKINIPFKFANQCASNPVYIPRRKKRKGYSK